MVFDILFICILNSSVCYINILLGYKHQSPAAPLTGLFTIIGELYKQTKCFLSFKGFSLAVKVIK